VSEAPAPAKAGAAGLAVRSGIGRFLLAPYLRLVKATSRVVYDPPDFWDRVAANWPVLITSWHGQSNLGYPLFPGPERFAIMVSTHPDGKLAEGLARGFGFDVIEGSGASERQRHGTGGVKAFRQMLRVLASGKSTIATGDVPPIEGRAVSPGLIAMARHSGRPIFAIGIASSRRKILTRIWDRMQFNYPFSTIGFVAEGPFYMDANGEQQERQTADLKASLDRVLEKAFALADGKVSG
jgi:lysophospholipid acyltransferase (LPLAT)-like uncharacterized protein